MSRTAGTDRSTLEAQDDGAVTDELRLLDARIDRLLDDVPPRQSPFVDFRGAQFDLGLAWVHFPEGCGGLALRPALQRHVGRRLHEAGAESPTIALAPFLSLAAPTIAAHGSAAMQRRFLRRGFTGEDLWCQLFSEPGAGSDLAGLACRAVRDGDEWAIDGQKVWNSLAHVAHFGILLARTDPSVPKHRGLTYFALDMRLPGVEVRPLVQMTGDPEFNEVYLTDVRVSDADRIGEVGNGWRVAATTLSNERNMLGGAGSSRRSGGGAIDEALRIWNEPGTEQDAVRRDRLMRLWCESETLRLTMLRSAQSRREGAPGPEASIGKLKFAMVNQGIYEFCIELLGAHGTIGYDYRAEGRQPIGFVGPAGAARLSFLRSRANSIEGGTSEIQRNIIGERVLGLPAEPRTDRDLAWCDEPRS